MRFNRLRVLSIVTAILVAASAAMAISGRGESIIYGRAPTPPPAAAKFSHRTHADKGVRCETCHAAATTSKRANDVLLPSSDTCASCHAAGSGADVAPTVVSNRQLVFDHATHAKSNIACARCHRTPEAIDAGRALPQMAECQACHDSARTPGHAASRCQTCHLADRDGVLIVNLPTGKLIPTDLTRDDAHTPAFRTQHRQAASGPAGRADCASCHKPDFCQTCHVGIVKPLDFHGNDFLTRHPIDARRADSRCQTCHRPQTFCLGCHERAGVGGGLPGKDFVPGGIQSFHPAGFAAGSAHGTEAKRNLRTCSSCHREDSCTACHADNPSAMRASPHGAGWRGSSRCQSLVDKNPRVCMRCHDEPMSCR